MEKTKRPEPFICDADGGWKRWWCTVGKGYCNAFHLEGSVQDDKLWRNAGLSMTLNGEEDQIGFALKLWWYYLYIGLNCEWLRKLFRYMKREHVSYNVSVGRTLWLNIEINHNTMESIYDAPLWKRLMHNGIRFIISYDRAFDKLLGSWGYYPIDSKRIDLDVSLLEVDLGNGHVMKFKGTAYYVPIERKFKRRYASLIMPKSLYGRFEVNIEQDGSDYKVYGKGENSWDCEDETLDYEGTIGIDYVAVDEPVQGAVKQKLQTLLTEKLQSSMSHHIQRRGLIK